MSGAWAKACDERAARLVAPERWEHWAAYHLGRAIWINVEPRESVGQEAACRASVLQAGAFIRAWRKSLPDQGKRMWDFSSQPSDTDLLWIALRCVGYAQQVPNADSLRSAEAALRTWHKRQVQP